MITRPPSLPALRAASSSQRSLIRKPSESRSVQIYARSFADDAIAPTQSVHGNVLNQSGADGRSFAAQLLELGLKHNVEGLINKASGQMELQANAPSPYDHYQAAQDNFADTHLVRWYV